MAHRWAGERYEPPAAVYGCKSPLWTIELMEQLRASKKLVSKMYTLSLGVEPHHRAITWYDANNAKDFDRISGIFQKCSEEGWQVEKVLMMFSVYDYHPVHNNQCLWFSLLQETRSAFGHHRFNRAR